MTQTLVQDVTLRDGMHSVRHQFTLDDRSGAIVAALDAAGVDAIEVSHGDGLGGSSFQYGPGSTPTGSGSRRRPSTVTRARARDAAAARDRNDARADGRRDLGVRSVRVATHCTEADIAAQHIEAARELGMDAVGFLMMSHMSRRRAGARRRS